MKKRKDHHSRKEDLWRSSGLAGIVHSVASSTHSHFTDVSASLTSEIVHPAYPTIPVDLSLANGGRSRWHTSHSTGFLGFLHSLLVRRRTKSLVIGYQWHGWPRVWRVKYIFCNSRSSCMDGRIPLSTRHWARLTIDKGKNVSSPTEMCWDIQISCATFKPTYQNVMEICPENAFNWGFSITIILSRAIFFLLPAQSAGF